MNKSKKKCNYPLVEVTWLDSSSYTGWQKAPATAPLECYSAGYLVHRDRVSMVVALNAAGSESNSLFGDTITIPARVVRRVRRLK